MGRHRISFVGTVKPKSQNQNSQQTKDEILLMVLKSGYSNHRLDGAKKTLVNNGMFNYLSLNWLL